MTEVTGYFAGFTFDDWVMFGCITVFGLILHVFVMLLCLVIFSTTPKKEKERLVNEPPQYSPMGTILIDILSNYIDKFKTNDAYYSMYYGNITVCYHRTWDHSDIYVNSLLCNEYFTLEDRKEINRLLKDYTSDMAAKAEVEQEENVRRTLESALHTLDADQYLLEQMRRLQLPMPSLGTPYTSCPTDKSSGDIFGRMEAVPKSNISKLPDYPSNDQGIGYDENVHPHEEQMAMYTDEDIVKKCPLKEIAKEAKTVQNVKFDPLNQKWVGVDYDQEWHKYVNWNQNNSK